jgi:membrane-associated phospholipid phosphatase
MIKKEWRSILLALIFLGVSALLFIVFIDSHEPVTRGKGIEFNDPLHALLPALDVSIPIFSITYGSLLLYIFFTHKQPLFLVRIMIAYGLIGLMRIVTIFLVPLREPSDLVYLEDPFLNNLIYPGEVVTDLFFSGHTALIFLIYLLSGRKIIFLVLTITMGILVMIQRVHYSIDVLAAIPFAWLAVYLSHFIIERVFNRINN